MKTVYLIAAHNNPELLKLLIAQLSSPSSHFIVHIDRKSDQSQFKFLDELQRTYRITDNISIHWGGFSQVDATLLMLHHAFSVTPDFDRAVLLSGSCFPVRNRDYIELFFTRHKNVEFMNSTKLPNKAVGKTLDRLRNFYFTPPVSKPQAFIQKVVNRLNIWPANRNIAAAFDNLQPYGGSNWWALTNQACQYILQKDANLAHLKKFLANSICADEIYFQTILSNSEFATRLSHNLTYADWSKGLANPETLTAAHMDWLAKEENLTVSDAYGHGEYLFARKFPEKPALLIDKLKSTATFNASAN